MTISHRRRRRRSFPLLAFWVCTDKSTAFSVLQAGRTLAGLKLSLASRGVRRTNHVRNFALHAKSGVDPAQLSTDDNEWHPHDPAHSLPQLMQGVWHQIAQGNVMQKGESMTVLYPNMEEELNQPRYLNLFLAHLDLCKDVCDHFGMTTHLKPHTDKLNKIQGFTVTSYRDPDKSEYDFDYDPFWDDGTDFDNLYKGIDDEAEGGAMPKDPYPEIVNKVPDDDDKLIDITKRWVSKMMTDLGLCPFTAGPEKAGLPIGPVHYAVDRCSTVEDMYSRYWLEVVRIENHKEKDIATTLLITPEFLLDNVELFESFCNTLTEGVTNLPGMDDLLQLVFFHPHWSFRDGGARSGEGQAANYARRSPWPMINLLRTSQVRAAQRGIPTGLVYKQNEKTLSSIGVDRLETMLRLRDWKDIEDVKVNRKEYDALKIAQDFQQTGAVAADDLTLAGDATPAANRADPAQLEQGDLVKVLCEALQKRLGKDSAVQPLSGPETSATALATDFLIKKLDAMAIAGSQSNGTTDPLTLTTATDFENEASRGAANDAGRGSTTGGVSTEREQLRQKQRDAARQALMDDVAGTDDAGSNDVATNSSNSKTDMTEVLFGRGGISTNKPTDDDDEEYNAGMNPETFY